jgi:hypothetical protein
MAFSQSAPRQRTAIACRYCRRRKVSRALQKQKPGNPPSISCTFVDHSTPPVPLMRYKNS